jgi:hypothetical protein
MKAYILTPEEVKQDEAREYNPSVWVENVDRYKNYEDVIFLKIPSDECFSYSRFFVVYTLPEGLRLLNTFSYSSCISSAGFREVTLNNFDINVEKTEIVNLEEGTVNIVKLPLYTKQDDGKLVECAIDNNPEARKWMIDRSKRYGAIFTKSI